MSEAAGMAFRSLAVRASTFSEETRTVEAVISTEQPVEMPDWTRMEMIPEVLLSSGVQMPPSRQVPFLDSHNRHSVKDQLGSARDVIEQDNQVSATLHFSRATHGESALGDVRDGHITDVSVGYEVLKRVFVPKGETKNISGRDFSGPVNVATSWKLREVSLTPIGADDQAKLRGLDPAAVIFQAPTEESFVMNEDLRALCESRGMDSELSDDDAQRWLLKNTDKLAEKKEEKKEETRAAVIDADAIAKAIQVAIRAEREAREAYEADVDAHCKLADLPGEAAFCRTLSNIAAVRTHLATKKEEAAAEIPFGSSVRVGTTGVDRLKAGIRDALALKSIRSAVNGNEAAVERHMPAASRSKDAEDFRHATLLDLATEYVRTMGVTVLGLTREQIAQCAMFGPEKAGVRGYRGDNPYHTTGSFANLTLDAINKSMMVGYSEVPSTWRGPMRQGDSVPDFKAINRMRLGGMPNLPAWNDTAAPEKASMADAKESYAVEARSMGIDFSYKLIVNDDMSALTRIPMSLGDAAARTVNAVAWSQVTSNPTTSDGKALFSAVSGNRKRKNLTTGAGAPSVTSVGLLTNLMRQMRGENTPEEAEGADILNLSPSYIVVPSALETVTQQLVNSAYDPSANLNQVFNTTRTLTPVIEPLLDADSTTAWYLFTNPTRIDTVEVTFLQGQETPQVRTVMDEHTLAMTYYVLQSVGAKALNHRGVQKHAGA